MRRKRNTKRERKLMTKATQHVITSGARGSRTKKRINRHRHRHKRVNEPRP